MFPWAAGYCGDIILDSGAFSFMSACDVDVNFDEYTEKYAEFIKAQGIKKFFELDIDSLVGYDEVLRFRARLEQLTGLPCIPVWHKSRGKDEFLRLCEKYSYVAIGGIVTREISVDEYRYFPWFIAQAHKKKCQIHALGFTTLKYLKKYPFDSVDSSAWTMGVRYGRLYKFTGNSLVQLPRVRGRKIPRQAMVEWNFREWYKFQQYGLRFL